MVTHKTLVERFGDSPALKIAKRIGKPVVCLISVDDQWVLTWTTGAKEVITLKDVSGLSVEPLYEETLTYTGFGNFHRRIFKSEGSTVFSPEKCPCCYDGLSFKDFSEIDVVLDKPADFYFEWDQVKVNQTKFTYRKN